jgi:ferredoxin/flavodoxin---NADP+ reductase
MIFDVAIVGAGPAGLYATYYAGFRGFSVAVIDSLTESGGQITALYPEKIIYDVAGIPRIKGKDLVTNLLDQVEPFHPTWFLGVRAEELAIEDGQARLTTDAGEVIRARAVVITGGIGTFAPRPLPGGEAFEDRGLRYFVGRLDDLAGKDVIVVGGGDSAVDWAMALEPVAASVALVHRRDTFRAHAYSVDQLRKSSVDVFTNTEVVEILGDDSVEAVELLDNVSGERWMLGADSIVAALGFVADLGPLKRWGLALEGRHIVTDPTMATSVPRVFAAGDIVTYPGKVPLISVGFGEAALAINNAASVIDPALKSFPGHSSDAPVLPEAATSPIA